MLRNKRIDAVNNKTQFSKIFICSFSDIMYFYRTFFYVLEGRGCGQGGIYEGGEYICRI